MRHVTPRIASSFDSSSRSRGLAGLVLALSSAAVGAAACSFTLDFRQCRDDSDCANAQGLDLVCEASECVMPTDPTTVSCSSNADCVDRFDDMHLCGPAGHCASLATAECSKVVMPSGAGIDDVAILGSITATAAPYEGIGVPLENAIQLAVEDFNSVARLPGGKQVAWVACDSEGDPDVASVAAEHLQDLGVLGIVGPTFSDSAIAVAEDVTIPGGTFLITPTATAAPITDLDDMGLVWRPIESDVHQAAALADRVAELEPRPEKVVIFAKNDAYGNGILDAVTPPLAARLDAGALITLKYSDPGTFETNEELLNEYGMRIAIAIGEAPDTIVIIGTSEARELILFYIDAWSALAPAQQPPLPHFIVTHGAVPVMEDVIDGIKEDSAFRPVLMDHMEGISPIVQDPDNFAAFNIRYKIRFDDAEALTISSLTYDSAMVVMLGAVATGETAPTGSQLAEAMPLLVDKAGTPVSFGGAGLAFIQSAIDTLEGGGSVDLKGVSGELDFDLATGEVRTDLIGWDLVPRAGDEFTPVLTAARLYTLDPPPANGGTWTEL
jgi:hypothetical protein